MSSSANQRPEGQKPTATINQTDSEIIITDYRGPYRKKKLIVTDMKHTGNDFSLLRFCCASVCFTVTNKNKN